MSNFETPILFIIFNRPDATRQVFEEIKKLKPKFLFVAADGPRSDKSGEKEKCLATREIIKDVDWDCELKTLFREKNLGCKLGVSSAIDWFFDYVEEGIIMEDDCLPDKSFFYFCQSLLERYRDDNLVMHIGGSNFQFGKKRGIASYYFSRYAHVWGWATWKRAWLEYDLKMSTYPEFKKNNFIKTIFDDTKIQKYWLRLFDKLYKNEIDTWDGQWIYSIYKNNGVSVIPNTNLITNIGFGEDSTHTKTKNIFSFILSSDIGGLVHSEIIQVDKEADLFFGSFLHRSMLRKIVDKVKSIF